VACSAKALALGLDSGEILLGSGSGDHGKPWFPLGSHAEAIRALAFIPDSNLLLSGSRDGTLKLWDIVSKGVGKDLPSHAARVNSISVSRTGLAASAGPDGIRLWEIPGCAPKLAIETNGAWVSDVSLSPDATRLAGGLLDGSVRVWDPDSGSLHWSAQADEGWCAAVAIHPNGRLVAAGYELGALILWDLEKGTRIKKVRVDGITEWQRNPCPIHALAWSADGMALAVAFGNIVRIYDQNLRTSEGPGWLLPLDWNDEYT
jgi:WD40 repeat protein